MYGSLLRACRDRSKINQDELAFQLHTSQGNISKIESGTIEPRISFFMKWLESTNSQDVLVALAQNIDLAIVIQTVVDSTTTIISTIILNKASTLLGSINFLW